jgi:DNA-binding IclR family transcriptional regulator
MIKKNPNDYNVRAVERAISILNCFDDKTPERGVSEIAKVVGLHKATTHRIVTTLVNYGYLERGEDDQRYRLGLMLVDLGSQVLRRMDLRDEAYPYMVQLVEKWDEVCDLSIFDRERVFYIEMVRGSHALTISADVGQMLPAHCTASGKMFLAHLPDQELDAFLSKSLQTYTSKTITSPEELRKQLNIFRRQGYSFDNEEMEEGIRGIAAPIHDHSNDVIAVISIPGPVSRMRMKRIPKIANSLVETAQAISHRMGWKVWDWKDI